MDIPTLVSIVALTISIGGLVVTFWATRISKKSVDHAIKVQERSDLMQFERDRSELLNQISDSQAILNRTRVEIGTLQANFRAEPKEVQSLMANHIALFSEYLPKVEQAIRQCDELWADISGWTTGKPYADQMHARAMLYRSLKDDEFVEETGKYLVDAFKKKLALAKQQLLLARRAGGSSES